MSFGHLKQFVIGFFNNVTFDFEVACAVLEVKMEKAVGTPRSNPHLVYKIAFDRKKYRSNDDRGDSNALRVAGAALMD